MSHRDGAFESRYIEGSMQNVRLTCATAFLMSSIVMFFGCGSDESSGNGAPPGGAGSPFDGGLDAQANGGGATSAAGGNGNVAFGGAGASSTGGAAGTSGDAGSVDAGGPACTARADLPSPIPRTASLESACPLASACGGSLSDTTWEVEAVCIEEDKLFPALSGVCSAATSGSLFQTSPSGTASFTTTDSNVSLTVDLSVSVDFPNPCHGCRCSDLETRLNGAGLDASCSPVCNGGTCTCTLQKTVSLSSTGKYTSSGGTLTTPSRSSLSYCIDAGVLTVRDPSAGATYSLRKPEDLHTPEICDGIDNDGNGKVDDNLAECPTCATVGACAEGVDAKCQGASGWSCTYTSKSWEQNETICDAIDNDCDGRTNEGLDCKEICDGVDNDANGTVDDSPEGGPTCTLVGVCSAGNAAACKGIAGWACVPAAATFESAETQCDGLDNDCNGAVDERCCAAGSARMYYGYVEMGASAATAAVIERSDLQGGNVQRLVTRPPATVIDVAVDTIGKKIYWGNLDANAIERANVNGTNVEKALSAGSQPRLALDVAHRFIFWVGPGIHRTSLDDLTSTTDLSIPVTPLTMTVDSQHGWLFMGAGNLIHRANLDGTGLVSIGPDIPVIGQVIEGIAVDPLSAKVYWTSAGGLHRANLDLSDPEYVIPLDNPHHVHVAPVARRLYWSETLSNDIGYMDIGATTPSYVKTDYVSLRLGDILDCPP